jgi:hypothetical protein
MPSISTTAANPFQGVLHPSDNLPLMDAAASRKTVQDIAHQIHVGSHHGKNRVGYLRIQNIGQVATAQETKVQVKSLGFFKRLFSRGDDVKAAKSADFLKNLLVAAYQDKVPEQELNKTLAAFDKHVARQGMDGVGGRHFARYVNQLEKLSLQSPGPGMDVVTEGQAEAFGNYIKPQGLERAELLEHKAQWGREMKVKVQHLLAGGVQNGQQVQLLGEGAEGRAYDGGAADILKVYNHPNAVGAHQDKHTIARRGDLAAIHAKKDMPHLALPQAYYLKAQFTPANGQEEKTVFYKVKADAIQDFCQQMADVASATDSSINLTHQGTVMARVAGQSLLNDKQAVDDPTFKKVALGLHAALLQMGENKFMHNDIKPDNIIFNPADQSLKLIDLGGLTKISDDPSRQQETLQLGRIGSPPFQSPLAFRQDPQTGEKMPHGAEADRYGCAMVLLASLEPEVMSPEFIQKLPPFLTMGPGQNPANHIKADRYLESMLETLDKAFPNGADALKARFEQQPLFKALIQKSFVASVPGEEARLAWQEVGSNIIPALVDEPVVGAVGSVPGSPRDFLQAARGASFDGVGHAASFISDRA